MKRAFVDAVTGILKCWGYVEENSPGEIRVDVPDDFTHEPGTVRYDAGSDAWLPVTLPRPPDVLGFERALVGYLGGPVAANALATHYPLLPRALSLHRFADVRALLDDALAKGILAQQQHADLLALAGQHGVPL